MRSTPVYAVEVNPHIPPALARLPQLAADLWYAWNRAARELFSLVSPGLWETVGHNPTLLLRYVDEARLIHCAADTEYMARYYSVFAQYDAYLADTSPRLSQQFPAELGTIAYFCAEFGIHESLPIYSGGLGILAGDHLKTASDLRLPLHCVGLFYHQGYFAQMLDRDGGQIATYNDTHATQLPVTPVLKDGAALRIAVELPGRTVQVDVWHVQVGHAHLYLLDADVPGNTPADREITRRLYGGDRVMRIEQEILLGIGGVRALRAVGIEPSAWHINEGHAAFLVLERVRELMKRGVAFEAALESVAGNTVFTTHTVVPAGHDHFDAGMIEQYFAAYCHDIGIDMAQLQALGRAGSDSRFNMTALALHGSRFHNAVSRIHGEVTAQMLQDFWPQVEAAENPVTHVTNAVHVPTFLDADWNVLFDRYLGADWYEHLHDPARVSKIFDIPDDQFWRVRQGLKSHMLHLVRHRVGAMYLRNNGNDSPLSRAFRHADPDKPDVLTIGFARRFATYKRAALLLEDLERLRGILQKDTPVLFIFAGKAHPADGGGQDVIRQIMRVAKTPEFEDKILLVEGYDLHLARRLVSGVDVWLNNPSYPLEASGTSGMKAGMNGVLNLSILDGWWAEGFKPGNGWGIKPVAQTLDEATRNREEARELYDTLQHEVLPLYYNRDKSGDNGIGGYSSAWVQMAKKSMVTMLSQFGTRRMLHDYARKLYAPAAQKGRRYAGRGHELAGQLAAWKSRVRAVWPRVSIEKPAAAAEQQAAAAVPRVPYGGYFRLEIAVHLAGLQPADVMVELLLERPLYEGSEPEGTQCTFFTPLGEPQGEVQRYSAELTPSYCGKLDCYIRIYPYHELLAHRFELGLMTWA